MVFLAKASRQFPAIVSLRFSRPFALSPRNGILPVGKSPCLGVASLKIHAHRERYLSKEEAKRLMLALEQSGHIAALAFAAHSAYWRKKKRDTQCPMGKW